MTPRTSVILCPKAPQLSSAARGSNVSTSRTTLQSREGFLPEQEAQTSSIPMEIKMPPPLLVTSKPNAPLLPAGKVSSCLDNWKCIT